MKVLIDKILKEQMGAMMSRSVTNRQLGAAGQRMNKPLAQPKDQMIPKHPVMIPDVSSHKIMPAQKVGWRSSSV